MISKRNLTILLLVLVVISSGSIYVFFQYLNQRPQRLDQTINGTTNGATNGTADLVINSASEKVNYTNTCDQCQNMPYANSYGLNISLKLVINGTMHFDYYVALSDCSFYLKVNSSIWKPIHLYCTMPPYATETFSGTYNFWLYLGINLINSTLTPWNSISVPFNLSFLVYSDSFNVSTPYYTLQVNN